MTRRSRSRSRAPTPLRPSSNAPTQRLHGLLLHGRRRRVDTITAFVDSNDNNTRDPSEPQQTATKRWLGTQPTIALAPETGQNPIDTTHTLTATVTDGGAPVAGVSVGFYVNPGVNGIVCAETGGFDGFVVTNASGEAVCTYTGFAGGTDTINAYADTNSDRFPTTGEPSDTATKTWTRRPDRVGEHDTGGRDERGGVRSTA